MSNLLHVIRLKSKAVKKGHAPLWVEFPVSLETAPFLVSSSSSVMWIAEAHPGNPGNMVKAAVREAGVGELFTEVVDAVTAMGRQQEWGNVHPLTIEGLGAAIEHVESYDFEDLELLTPRQKFIEEALPEDEGESDERVIGVLVPDVSPAMQAVLDEFDLPMRPSSWVPDECVVVVPRDRSFVGVVARVTGKKIAGVVHNAARGIAIARGLDELAGDSSSELPTDAGD